MTRGINTRVLVGGYLLSSQTNSSSIQATLEQIETTPFEASGREYVVLPPAASIELNGYLAFDTAGGATYENRLRQAFDDADTVGIIHYDAALAGSPGYVLADANADKMKIAAPTDGVITIEGGFVGQGGLVRGLCAYSGQVTATGTLPPVDFGAAGAAGGRAFLFATAEGGAGTNATIAVESATTSGGTYSSKGTLTFSGIGAYSLSMTGTINRYIRLNVTSLGGATSWTITCIVGVAGVTY